MQPRIDVQKVAPAAFRAMLALSNYDGNSSRLEPSLLELVKMRASQINGCAYCIDLRSKGATDQVREVCDRLQKAEVPMKLDLGVQGPNLVFQCTGPDSIPVEVRAPKDN